MDHELRINLITSYGIIMTNFLFKIFLMCVSDSKTEKEEKNVMKIKISKERFSKGIEKEKVIGGRSWKGLDYLKDHCELYRCGIC